ncbi:MAG TPA: glycosyltransferase family 9 protein [Parasulfuritortus sp.]
MTKKLILYSHDGKLGDAVVMTGLVEALHRAGHAVYVTASRGNIAFWRADRRLAGVVEVPKTGLFGKLSAIRQLRWIKADWLFSWDLHRSSTGTLLARLSGAGRKVGFWRGGAAVFDDLLAFDPACEHITRKYERAAALLGVSLSRPKLGFPVAAADLDLPAGKRVFVNFFGSVPDKSLNEVIIRSVLKRLAEDFADCIFLVCHMRHQGWIEERVAGYANIRAIRTDAGPDDLYGAIQACDAVMTVDTSIAHIAAALGKPLLDIFCKNAQARVNFSPVGERVMIVESASPEVISEIDPDELVSSLRALLAQN